MLHSKIFSNYFFLFSKISLMWLIEKKQNLDVSFCLKLLQKNCVLFFVPSSQWACSCFRGSCVVHCIQASAISQSRLEGVMCERYTADGYVYPFPGKMAAVQACAPSVRPSLSSAATPYCIPDCILQRRLPIAASPHRVSNPIRGSKWRREPRRIIYCTTSSCICF